MIRFSLETTPKFAPHPSPFGGPYTLDPGGSKHSAGRENAHRTLQERLAAKEKENNEE